MPALVVLLGLAVVAVVLSRSSGTPGGRGSGGDSVLHPEIKRRVEEHRRRAEIEGVRPGTSIELVLAVVARESGGDAGALGDFGRSFGLMQIQQSTWQDYQTATADPDTVVWPDAMLDPRLNIRVGSWTLADRIEKMGSQSDGLRAFNCGVTGALRNPSCGADYARWILEVGVPAFRDVA